MRRRRWTGGGSAGSSAGSDIGRFCIFELCGTPQATPFVGWFLQLTLGEHILWESEAAAATRRHDVGGRAQLPARSLLKNDANFQFANARGNGLFFPGDLSLPLSVSKNCEPAPLFSHELSRRTTSRAGSVKLANKHQTGPQRRT